MKEKYNFLNYDIYSKRIGFYFNNSEKIGSYYGLCLTILYVISSLILFLVLLLRSIQKKEMKVSDSTIFSIETPNIDVNPTSIYFAFGLEDPITSNRFVDETIYFPKIIYFDREKIKGEFQTVNRREMDFEVCKEEGFGPDYQNLLLKGELSNSYCLKDYNLTLSGGYKYNRMSYFRIRLYPCVNTTENNNHCKSPDIIDNYFKGGYFSILTKDIGLNPSNYTYPTLAILQDLYTTIDKQIYKDYILYYGITEVQTDTGIFFESIETKRFLDFRKETETINFRDESEFYEGKAVCTIAFRLDDIIKIQKRSYIKLKEVFSSTGGYMQLISTIFSLISFIANKLIPELKIMNGIFKFNLSQQKMMIRINSIKEFNSINFPKKSNYYTYFPNKNIFFHKKKSHMNMNMSNISKDSLIGIHNNNDDNNSSIDIVFNNKDISFNQKEGSSKHNNIMTDENHKISAFKEVKIKLNKDKSYKNGENIQMKLNRNISKSYAPNEQGRDKFKSDYNDKIDFNFLQYICLSKYCEKEKEKEIELFNSGIAIYKKRMDIVNVFTFLLLIDNFLVENQDFYSL